MSVPATSVPGLSALPTAPPAPQSVGGHTGTAAMFIVLAVKDDPDSAAAVRDWCADIAAHVRSLTVRVPEGQLRCVVGFGSDAWDRLFGSPRPADLHPFRELRSGNRVAPATPGDLFMHLRAERMDLCFELATQLMARLGSAVTPVDEVQAFRSFDARSMVGFVDGTENPQGSEAVDFTIIGGEDPDFSGGSYAIVQKYLHRMDAWNALPVEEQEKVIGRTKHNDIELADDVKPANAHNALTVITDEDGNEQKIVRDNLPFGSPSSGVFGTYFIGYSRTPAITEKMLSNMFLGDPPGNYDRLLDFSDAKTGTLFFVPSAELLEALAERVPAAAAAAAPASAAASASAPTPISAATSPPTPVASAAPKTLGTAAPAKSDTPPSGGRLTIGSLKADRSAAAVIIGSTDDKS